MADRRKRRNTRRRGMAGCLTVLAAAVLISAVGAGAGTWMQVRIKSFLNGREGKTVEVTADTSGEQQAEFPALTVSEESVHANYCYGLLGQKEQTVYRELLQGVENMEETILLHAGKNDAPEKIYEYLLYDRPELFWCSGSSRMTVYEDFTEFGPDYTCPEEERDARQKEIDSAVSECLSGMDGESGDYEKIRYIFDYLVKTVDYDETASDNQNIYSALVGKRSVCAGYSRAAQYLLEKAGIESIFVVGTITGQGAHAWNIVKCGENYYHMDVTFGDPVFFSAESGDRLPGNYVNYEYLCCTDEDIGADHEMNSGISYPSCVSDDLNYYKLNGMYYESYDEQVLMDAMNQSIYEEEETFVCKFADQETYNLAAEEIKEVLLPRAAKNLAAMYGLNSVQYTYVDDDVHNKIMVFWNYQ